MRGVKRSFDQTAIDAAIAANEQPRVPRSSSGLVLTVPGGRARSLMDSSGGLTEAGEYYYTTTEQRAPSAKIDYGQQPERMGQQNDG